MQVFFIKLLSDSLSFHINKSLYFNFKQNILFIHSYYAFIRSFVYVIVSSKTTNAIHYVSSTTKIMYYFKMTTDTKQSMVLKPSCKSVLPLNQYKRLNLTCGNTWPKLLEVSYGRTSQHNEGLVTVSSPRTHSERARHGGFLTLDAEHRTDIRRPLDQPHSTTTETDEDGDRRKRARRRQTKTETVEDEERLTLGTSKCQLPNRVTKTEADEDEDEDRATLGTSAVAAP